MMARRASKYFGTFDVSRPYSNGGKVAGVLQIAQTVGRVGDSAIVSRWCRETENWMFHPYSSRIPPFWIRPRDDQDQSVDPRGHFAKRLRQSIDLRARLDGGIEQPAYQRTVQRSSGDDAA